jgi:hypothetical protein
MLAVPAEGDMPISRDEVDGAMTKVVEKEMVNTRSRLMSCRFQPMEKSKIYIPMCRLVGLQAVRPALAKDIYELGSHFIKVGYMDGFGAFYMALEDDCGRTVDVTKEITEKWSPLWKRRNEEFEEYISRDEHLKVFCNKMFHVWDGNHRLECWMPIINREHPDDYSWHFKVECIILEVKGNVVNMLTALHEINWYYSKPSQCMLPFSA